LVNASIVDDPIENGEEVQTMKKITVRKAGSIRLTSPSVPYLPC